MVAYNLKLLIDKGIYDVLKPAWVIDSIELGHTAPFQKKYVHDYVLQHQLIVSRYFFHASDARAETDEYNEDVEDDDEDDAPVPGPSTKRSQSPVVVPKEEEVDIDPTLADWLKIDNTSADDEGVKHEPDSTTDEDSDNADVADEDEDHDLDDWFSVKKSPTQVETEVLSDQTQESFVDIRMGETDTAMEYDQDFIFKHLCVISHGSRCPLMVFLKMFLS